MPEIMKQQFYWWGFSVNGLILTGIFGHLVTLTFNSSHAGDDIQWETGQLRKPSLEKHLENSKAPLLHSSLEFTSASYEPKHFSMAASTTGLSTSSVCAKSSVMACLFSFLSSVSRPSSDNMHSAMHTRAILYWKRTLIISLDEKRSKIWNVAYF